MKRKGVPRQRVLAGLWKSEICCAHCLTQRFYGCPEGRMPGPLSRHIFWCRYPCRHKSLVSHTGRFTFNFSP